MVSLATETQVEWLCDQDFKANLVLVSVTMFN